MADTDETSPDPGARTLLLVDDERAHLETLEKLFRREGYEVLIADTGEEGLDKLRGHRVHLLVTDLMLPELDGMDLLRLSRKISPETEVILMSAFGTVERAVAGIKEGAYDFVTKPIKRASILKSARQALERQALLAENRELRARLAELRDKRSIVGQSPALREAIELVRQVAPSEATVLLTGESGTGKELFAKMIVDESDRADAPFITVNCAALPESILESELFGYEKGAFTGANQRKIGRFEAADGGTLFLDEIGELSPRVQIKLLRVLQEQTFERLGSNTPTAVDVRIITATHRDLEEEMSEGDFREDLYYRLNVVNIDIPPLRARLEDVPLLAEHFLGHYRDKNDRDIRAFSTEALDAMSSYGWPGNVRELENIVERAVVLDSDGVIGLDDLPGHLRDRQDDEPRTLTITLGTPLDEIERTVIHETLRMTNGNKKLAAKLLGIATRTIYRKI
jgi:two-component system response regulator HydG